MTEYVLEQVSVESLNWLNGSEDKKFSSDKYR